MRNSYVFYRSFRTALELFTDTEELMLRRAIENYALDDAEPEQLPSNLQAVFEVAKANIDSANKRYDKRNESEAQNGRPKKWIEQEKAEALFQKLGSWNAVARELKVSRETLRKARETWKEHPTEAAQKRPETAQKPRPKSSQSLLAGFWAGENRETIEKPTKIQTAQKPKNLNYNDNDNVEEDIKSSSSTIGIVKEEDKRTQHGRSGGTQLEAVPPPSGWEWRGGVLEDEGHHFRLAINKQTREGRGIQLD